MARTQRGTRGGATSGSYPGDGNTGRTAIKVLLYILVVAVVVAAVYAVFRLAVGARTGGWDWREKFTGGPPQRTLVYVRMRGCPYCLRFDPTWARLKKAHGDTLRALGVGTAEYESSSPEAAALGARTFPTVMMAETEDMRPVAVFEGTRDVDSLLEFAKAHAPPPADSS